MYIREAMQQLQTLSLNLVKAPAGILHYNESQESLDIAKALTTRAVVRDILELRARGIYPNIIMPLNGSAEVVAEVFALLTQRLGNEAAQEYFGHIISTLKNGEDIEICGEFDPMAPTCFVDELVDEAGQLKLLKNKYSPSDLRVYAWLQKHHTPAILNELGIDAENIHIAATAHADLPDAPWITSGWLLNSGIGFDVSKYPSDQQSLYRSIFAAAERVSPVMYAINWRDNPKLWSQDYQSLILQLALEYIYENSHNEMVFMTYCLLEYWKGDLEVGHEITMLALAGDEAEIRNRFTALFGSMPAELLRYKELGIAGEA